MRSHWTTPEHGFSSDCFPRTITPHPSGDLKQLQIHCLRLVSLLSLYWGFLQTMGRFALFWDETLYHPSKVTNTRHWKRDQTQECRIRAKLSAWHSAKPWACFTSVWVLFSQMCEFPLLGLSVLYKWGFVEDLWYKFMLYNWSLKNYFGWWICRH